MTNKEKFISFCNKADLIVMGGIPMEYLPSCNQLSYRVLGEYNYFSLDDLDDLSISYNDKEWIISRHGALFKFKFYTELPTELS
jgi:hypothetical protein